MKKALINTPDLSKGGGVSVYWNTIYKQLNMVEATLFTIGRKKKTESRFERFVRMLSDYYKFYYTLKINNPDVVLINPSLQINAVIRDAVYIIISKLRKAKVISFFHGWDIKFEETVRRKYKCVFKYIFFKADVIVVLSNEFKEKFLSLGCKKPIFVESTTIKECAKPRNVKTNKAKISLLFLSRVEKEKGIYDVLELYKEVKKSHPDVRLMVSGEGSELENCRNLIIKENIQDVSFSGFVAGVKKEEMFLSADIFILPTTHGEGMPIALLEAMSYSMPVITMKVGGIRDFFKNGEMGYAFAQYDKKKMKIEIEKMIHNRNKIVRLGKANRKFALKYFSSSLVAERIGKIIKYTISGKNKPSMHWLCE